MNLILKLICKYMIVINNNDYSNPHEVLICVAIKKTIKVIIKILIIKIMKI